MEAKAARRFTLARFAKPESYLHKELDTDKLIMYSTARGRIDRLINTYRAGRPPKRLGRYNKDYVRSARSYLTTYALKPQVK